MEKHKIQLEELELKSVKLVPIYAGSEVIHYVFTCTKDKNLKGCEVYFGDYSGKIELVDKSYFKSILIKQKRDLPRSIYPFLSEGKIVIGFKRFGFEYFKFIKEFRNSDAE